MNPLFAFATPKRLDFASPGNQTTTDKSHGKPLYPIAQKMLYFESSKLCLIQRSNLCYILPERNSEGLSVEDLLMRLTKFEDKTISSDNEDAPFGDLPKSKKICLSINSAFQAVKS